MYESFYKLDPTPFRLTPDPHFFFNSSSHERGLAFLRYAFHQSEGFVVITGAPGTGKTELMLNLIQELPHQQTSFAKIVTSNLAANDLLELVAGSFLLSPQTGHKGMLLKNLEDFFASQHQMGKQVLLLIDEAHNLSTSALVELSMLSNFQIKEKPVIQCFLLGQPGLEEKLDQPELTHLKQRVLASTQLDTFNERETQAYIEHRLTKAGWLGNPDFSHKAYALIYQFTKGTPRKINSLCNRVLLEAYLKETHHIDAKLVSKIVEEMQEEAIVPRSKLDLDFAKLESNEDLVLEDNTTGALDEPIGTPEHQLPHTSVTSNVVDVSSFIRKGGNHHKTPDWLSSTNKSPEKPTTGSGTWHRNTKPTSHQEKESVDNAGVVSNNSNVHGFPTNTRPVLNNDSATHNKHTTSEVQRPAKPENTDADRPGLLDKELRALASWYTPPSQQQPSPKTNNDLTAENHKATDKKVIIDDLVDQEYVLEQKESIEVTNEPTLTSGATWFPFSRMGVAISITCLVVLWWFTYGPGVNYTLQVFEALNSAIEALLVEIQANTSRR